MHLVALTLPYFCNRSAWHLHRIINQSISFSSYRPQVSYGVDPGAWKNAQTYRETYRGDGPRERYRGPSKILVVMILYPHRLCQQSTRSSVPPYRYSMRQYAGNENVQDHESRNIVGDQKDHGPYRHLSVLENGGDTCQNSQKGRTNAVHPSTPRSEMC
jgi:hypothetical protein